MFKIPAALVATALLTLPAQAADSIDPEAFVATLIGEFDSQQQQAEDLRNGVSEGEAHGRVNRTFARVDAPAVGDVVVVTTTSYYLPPWYFDNNEFMVWTVMASESGEALVMSPQRFKDFDRFLPYANAPQKLADFSPDDLQPAVGGAACNLVWTLTSTGYSGRSEPCRVHSITQNRVLTWAWEFELTGTALWIAFSGTDDGGTVLDGSPAGKPYRLDRVER